MWERVESGISCRGAAGLRPAPRPTSLSYFVSTNGLACALHGIEETHHHLRKLLLAAQVGGMPGIEQQEA